MLRAFGEKGGVGVYTRNVTRELLDLDDENEYLLLYSEPEHMGTHAARPRVTERVLSFYFDYISHHTPISKRSKVAGWLYLHLPMTAGIAATGAAILNVVEHAGEPLTREGRWLLVGMGATAHHYRWQIAIKTKGQTAQTTVNGIQWQVGRTGNITPVMEVEPVSLSGATIRRVTAHHAGNIRDAHIGTGTRIEIIRSGEVIPKLEKVVESKGEVRLPESCPSCSNPVVWQNDFLKCSNSRCRAQIEQRISHWFRILGNADWFGIKSIQKMVAGGFELIS